MKTIIIVEDDPAIQDAMRLMLENKNYNVVIFSNGDPIFENKFKSPGLFILDKQVSGADGLEVCRYLKKNDRTHNIPVIMLSASPYVRKMAENAGADDFLEKPFKIKEFRDMVAKYVA